MNIFTYGSLMFPEVIKALTATDPTFEDIAIKGFERRAIIDATYPGLRECTGSTVSGRLWFDLNAEAMHILDEFEDELYERRTIEIESQTRGLVQARVYIVLRSSEESLSSESWDPAYFERECLPEYVSMCRKFRNKILLKLKSA